MEGHWFKFKDREVYLTGDEIFMVHEYYVLKRNEDYLKENYPELPDEMIKSMASDWRDTELQEGYSNEEALEEVLKEYGLIEEDEEDY